MGKIGFRKNKPISTKDRADAVINNAGGLTFKASDSAVALIGCIASYMGNEPTYYPDKKVSKTTVLVGVGVTITLDLQMFRMFLKNIVKV